MVLDAAAEDFAGISELSIGDAFSSAEDFGRPRGRTTCPAIVVGLDLRLLGDFATGIFVASLDKASARRLF